MNSKASLLSSKGSQYEPVPDEELGDAYSGKCSSETLDFTVEKEIRPRLTHGFKAYIPWFLHGLLIGANLIFFFSVLQYRDSPRHVSEPKGLSYFQSMLAINHFGLW